MGYSQELLEDRTLVCGYSTLSAVNPSDLED